MCRNCAENSAACDDSTGTHIRCSRCSHEICNHHSEIYEVETRVCAFCVHEDTEHLIWESMELASSSEDDEAEVGYFMAMDAWYEANEPVNTPLPASPSLPPPFTFGDRKGVDECCSICLDPMQASHRAVQLPCNPTHEFHDACISSRWGVKPACPLCRK